MKLSKKKLNTHLDKALQAAIDALDTPEFASQDVHMNVRLSISLPAVNGMIATADVCVCKGADGIRRPRPCNECVKPNSSD